jgi:hypothetical protein
MNIGMERGRARMVERKAGKRKAVLNRGFQIVIR